MAKFDKVAYSYDNFVFRICCRIIHNQSIQTIKEYLNNNARILDLGCATGNFLGKLTRHNNTLQLVGLDESVEMLKIARQKHDGITFILGDATNLPFPNSFFDIVTMIDTFNYFPNKNKVLSECSRVLKPKGILFFYGPSIDHFFSKLSVLINKWYYTERGTKHLPIKNIELLAGQNNLKISKKVLRRWIFWPLLRCWLITFRKIADTSQPAPVNLDNVS